jgi:predicted enzyme related to lactoylglutathione lyase
VVVPDPGAGAAAVPDPGAGAAARLRIGNIVLRVDDLERAASFWEAALGFGRSPHASEDWILLLAPGGAGPNLALDLHAAAPRVPPRIHLDLYAADQVAEVARLLALGATEVQWDKRPADADYVILADPEGNRFCVVDAGG